MGLLHLLNPQTLILLFLNHNHEKKCNKSLALKTSFHPSKYLDFLEARNFFPQTPCLELAPPLTLNRGSALEYICVLFFKTHVTVYKYNEHQILKESHMHRFLLDNPHGSLLQSQIKTTMNIDSTCCTAFLNKTIF